MILKNSKVVIVFEMYRNIFSLVLEGRVAEEQGGH